MRVEFFGKPEAQLLGVFHHPKDKRRAPLLICSSLGHENGKGHRALRILAERWGGPAFRFDWRGCGDSAGESPRSLADLSEDLQLACEQILSATGTEKITIVGLRIGALIAQATPLRVPARVIGWYAPKSGEDWLKELQAIEENFRVLSHVKRDFERNELVGTFFTDTLLRDLKDLKPVVGENVDDAFADDWSLPTHCEIQWLPGPSLASMIARIES
jgi:pimeloyl-ACP methyl ester carboxylesterase